MPVPNRQLKPARARLQPGEQVVLAAQGTNAKTGAIVRGGLLGLAAAAAVSVGSALLLKRVTVYSFWLPFAGAGWAAKRSPMDNGNPPFALAMTNIFVLTTHQMQVWAYDIGTNQGKRNRLTRFLGTIPRHEIAGAAHEGKLVTLAFRDGRSIRTKMSAKDARRLTEQLPVAQAPSAAFTVPAGPPALSASGNAGPWPGSPVPPPPPPMSVATALAAPPQAAVPTTSFVPPPPPRAVPPPPRV